MMLIIKIGLLATVSRVMLPALDLDFFGVVKVSFLFKIVVGFNTHVAGVPPAHGFWFEAPRLPYNAKPFYMFDAHQLAHRTALADALRQ
jgi:hypothetical protein